MGGLRPPKREKGDFVEWLEYESREGCRGGKANFSWDKLHTSKDRVFYVGNSMKVTKARANMGKNLLWWSDDKNKSNLAKSSVAKTKIQNELAEVKRQEEEAMNAILNRSSSKQRTSSGDVNRN